MLIEYSFEFLGFFFRPSSWLLKDSSVLARFSFHIIVLRSLEVYKVNFSILYIIIDKNMSFEMIFIYANDIVFVCDDGYKL